MLCYHCSIIIRKCYLLSHNWLKVNQKPPLDLANDDLDTENDSETVGILDEFQVMEEEMDTVEQQDSEFEASCSESEDYESDWFWSIAPK